MSDIERSSSRSASPRRPRTADGGLRDSRSHSRSRKSRERKESHRPVKEYSRSRSRSVSRGRKSYRSSKYASAGHRGSSRSRSRSRSRSTHRCLGVFGLSIFTTEQQVHHIFSKYGPVERIQVVIDAKTGHSKGYCFVYFESLEDAKVAKEQCAGMEIDGRRMRVDYSITQRAHTPTPGIYLGKPTHLHDRGWDGPRRRDSYRGSYRRSPSPYYNRRRGRYDRSRSRSYSPRRY
uniref:Transformer 2 transcript variant 233 n=1 Tax=Apis mellifera TaxID=7460 RepID=I1Z8F6_APIME|nr:transformer 2 transcript variant 233 [Apis mellifera]